MFSFTAPGDGTGTLQSTPPVGSWVIVYPVRTWPVEVTGRTVTLTVAVTPVVADPAAVPKPAVQARTRAAAATAVRTRITDSVHSTSGVTSIDPPAPICEGSPRRAL
jgi:hypothetical protein